MLQLWLLAVSLAGPAASAPQPAVTGPSSNVAQISRESVPYHPLNNQRTYPYNAVQHNNLYSNIYYSGGGNYYDPAAYNYNRHSAQTNSLVAKSHEPLRMEPDDDDNKVILKAKPKKFLHLRGLKTKSAGAGSSPVIEKPVTVGLFIHSDENGGLSRRQHGQFGHFGNEKRFTAIKPSFVQKDPSFHEKKSSTLKKDSVHTANGSVKRDSTGKDFSFNKKAVFSKIDVLGPNHKQIFSAGKRVFDNGQVQGPRPDELSNLRLSDVRKGSGSSSDSYGFYSDLSNLYSDKSFDGNQLLDETFNRRQSSNNLMLDGKQSTVSTSKPAFTAGPGRFFDGIDGISSQSILPATGVDGDSYGFYSDLSNLYGDKPWKEAESATVLEATPTFKEFDAELSQNRLDFDNNAALATGQFSQGVSPRDQELDSYGYYSDLDNLYRLEKQKDSLVGKKSATKSKKKHKAGSNHKLSFGGFKAGLSTNKHMFSSQKPIAGDKFNQKTFPKDVGFDSYGFYSDPGNLYGADSSQSLRAGPVTRGQSQLNPALTGHRDSSPAPTDPTHQFQTQTQVRDRIDPNRRLQTHTQIRDRAPQDGGLGSFGRGDLDSSRSTQNAVDFDSYGFYSDPRNLYTKGVAPLVS